MKAQREAARTGRRSLDRDDPLPLWAQLRADLLQRAGAGEFDTEVPTEVALVAEYGVSRHTVREAMRGLRAEGVFTAGRGRRPGLASQVIEQPLGALYSLFSSVEAAGLSQHSVVRALDVRADGVFAERLGLESSTPLLYLERLRLAGAEPLAIDRVWLPASIASGLLDVDFTHTGLYRELARCGVRVQGGREHIRATTPSPTERELLCLGPDESCLAIDRIGTAAGRAVEWRHTLVRGDRFSLVADFSARRGYRIDPSAGAMVFTGAGGHPGVRLQPSR